MVDKETHCRVRTVQLWKTWKAINFIFFQAWKSHGIQLLVLESRGNKSYVW